MKTANGTFYRAFHVDPSETKGRMIWELGNGQWDIPKLRKQLEDVLPENGAFDDYEVEHEFPEIGRRFMVLTARRVDHMQLILLAIEDRTEAREAATALADSKARHRVLVESLAQAVWETDPQGVVVEDSPSWRAATGETTEDWLGEGWAEAVHPDDRDDALRQWREIVAAERNVDAEFRLRAAEGGWRWTNVRAAPLRDEEGRILKWIGMNVDITARKEAEEERELLLGELNHRVKNVFAVIRSLAAQSDGARTAADYQRVFLGRLDALVRAHTLALESRWRSIDLATLVARTLDPYAAERPEAVETRGEPADLDPRRALSLSLVLHELATNALKYGALSAPKGQVRLTWRAETAEAEGARRVRMVWEERGGPPVEPPERG